MFWVPAIDLKACTLSPNHTPSLVNFNSFFFFGEPLIDVFWFMPFMLPCMEYMTDYLLSLSFPFVLYCIT